jgi:hypothetical protein
MRVSTESLLSNGSACYSVSSFKYLTLWLPNVELTVLLFHCSVYGVFYVLARGMSHVCSVNVIVVCKVCCDEMIEILFAKIIRTLHGRVAYDLLQLSDPQSTSRNLGKRLNNLRVWDFLYKNITQRVSICLFL